MPDTKWALSHLQQEANYFTFPSILNQLLVTCGHQGWPTLKCEGTYEETKGKKQFLAKKKKEKTNQNKTKQNQNPQHWSTWELIKSKYISKYISTYPEWTCNPGKYISLNIHENTVQHVEKKCFQNEQKKSQATMYASSRTGLYRR